MKECKYGIVGQPCKCNLPNELRTPQDALCFEEVKDIEKEVFPNIPAPKSYPEYRIRKRRKRK